MSKKKLLAMSNRETEDRAIKFVIAHEQAAGRTATDIRGKQGSKVDLKSFDKTADKEWLIEVKAFGGTGRGDDLWLEESQVDVLENVADSHLYLVINARAVDESEMRILDLTGEQLSRRLKDKRPKSYFEVPVPVADYDDLLGKAMNSPATPGAE